MTAAAVAQTLRRIPDALQRVAFKLDEPGADGFRRSWIMLFPVGQFSHPEYGTLNFSRQRLSEIKRNFDQRVRHIDVALDANHDQDRATAWVERVELREGAGLSGESAGLWGLVRWTPLGEQLVRDQIYRYFSPEFGDWTDPATGRAYHNVLMGGALTNRPFLKEMPALALAEVSTRPWGQVDKSKLPDACFLDPKARRLPIYEGAGSIGSDGRYAKRGKLNINAVKAALAAVHGARSGKPMTGLPSGTAARLERLLAKYTGGGSGGSGGGDASNKAASGEGESVGTQVMQLMGGSGAGMAKGPLGPHGVGGDMGDECEEPEALAEGEGAAQFADADGDGDGDGPGFDAESNTHGAMTVKSHSHGKYAAHGHSGDGDHSDAELDDMGGDMAYAEPDETGGDDEEQEAKGKSLRDPVSGLTFDELAKQFREMQFQLYEGSVEKTVAALSEKLPARYALSKVLSDRVRKWLLGSGYQLSEGRRGEVLDLLKLALSDRALVDTSKLGDAFTQETRVTVRQGGPNAGRHVPEDEARMVELAQMMAMGDKKLERGQTLTALKVEDRERYMDLAAKEVGYK